MGGGVMRLEPFFLERCQAFIEGLTPAEKLDRLAAMIANAQLDKDAGHGPPQDEINAARRLWLNLYNQLYGRAA